MQIHKLLSLCCQIVHESKNTKQYSKRMSHETAEIEETFSFEIMFICFPLVIENELSNKKIGAVRQR